MMSMKDIQALKKATEQRKKANPNLTDIDAADYYAQPEPVASSP